MSNFNVDIENNFDDFNMGVMTVIGSNVNLKNSKIKINGDLEIDRYS